ncbi:acylphosphatase-2 isoform X1 [Echinops telfairi]|uniref:Acylphosphatase-2 isoform X1 n=1 Tax=Echinops telfairi TaxID=9371 RepID=A0AC55DE77_ECHTE|nr:acylphosphatase-2 isoform X1 [Echinops telfairi]
MSSNGSLKSVDYEVFGNVQGVCFRMYTEGEAKKLGVVGWVKNTSKGTVTGQVQGPEEKVNSMGRIHVSLPSKEECASEPGSPPEIDRHMEAGRPTAGSTEQSWRGKRRLWFWG